MKNKGGSTKIPRPEAVPFQKKADNFDVTGKDMRADWTKTYRNPTVAQRYNQRFSGLGRWSNWLIQRAVLRLLRKAGQGRLPRLVVDAPAGTGRFTSLLRGHGVHMIHLDASAEMLAVLQQNHGPGQEVVGDLHHSPLRFQPEGAVLCFRFLQHLDSELRQKTLRSLSRLAPWAVVAYYPGWHSKTWSRRWKQRLGLRTKKIREFIPLSTLRAEVDATGWKLEAIRPVAPLFSENVLLLLSQK